MRLYLVQHGEALPKERDPDRPLSARGRADVARVAALLGASGVRPGRILHSGKTRARETAELLGAALAPDVPPEAASGLDPGDDVAPWVRKVPGWADDAMLVGHLPFMERLAARLLAGRGEGVVAFEPGAVLCLERTDGAWAVAWMLRPSLLGEGSASA